MQLTINLPGYENLDIHLSEQGEIQSASLCCTKTTIDLFKNFCQKHGRIINRWPLKELKGEGGGMIGKDVEARRSLLLIQELILKAKGEWKLPYAGEIVCACREVSSEKISDAISAKANSLDEVSSWTTATTSCTTCKDKVLEIINYRLNFLPKLIEETP